MQKFVVHVLSRWPPPTLYVTELDKFLSERDIRLSKDRINCGGGNYGEIEVLDNIVRFSSENRYPYLYAYDTHSGQECIWLSSCVHHIPTATPSSELCAASIAVVP